MPFTGAVSISISMRSFARIVLFSLTLLVLTLSHPSHSAPLPSVPSPSRPFSSSLHLRHLLSRNDSRHDIEERIENSNEQQARDMQQQYQQDRDKQQQQQQHDSKHTRHTTDYSEGDVDRDAVVTGDELRHARDPKQQQKQQQQVINNGTTTPPPSDQREDRRDEEADKADQAGDLARSAEQQRQEKGEGEQLVDSDEQSNATNMTLQNNGSSSIGEQHPYDHNTQKSGTYNRTSHSSHHNSSEAAGPYNGTDGRLDQSSPYHNTDPQARTWSQQRQNVPPNTPANFTAPAPPNSTYPSPSNPPPFDPSHPSSQQQQPPISSHNSTGHDNPYGYPQPVPSVDHAQRLVVEGEAASGSDMLESESGSDADDEYDSQATQNSTSSGAPDQQEMEAVISQEASTAAANGTGEPVQEPGNNVQWSVFSEEEQRHNGANDDDDGSSNISEDIRDKHNGGNRLRNEPRGSSQLPSNDDRDAERQHDKHNGGHHLDGELSSSHASSNVAAEDMVDMVDVEQAVSGGSLTSWVVVLLVLCGVAFGVGWWLRRVQQQQKYEPVEQYDAYGDVVEEEESESEYESQRVQVRVY